MFLFLGIYALLLMAAGNFFGKSLKLRLATVTGRPIFVKTLLQSWEPILLRKIVFCLIFPLLFYYPFLTLISWAFIVIDTVTRLESLDFNAIVSFTKNKKEVTFLSLRFIIHIKFPILLI